VINNTVYNVNHYTLCHQTAHTLSARYAQHQSLTATSAPHPQSACNVQQATSYLYKNSHVSSVPSMFQTAFTVRVNQNVYCAIVNISFKVVNARSVHLP
jgi:hypothetical protein